MTVSKIVNILAFIVGHGLDYTVCLIPSTTL